MGYLILSGSYVPFNYSYASILDVVVLTLVFVTVFCL
jgi:hypothetical protein